MKKTFVLFAVLFSLIGLSQNSKVDSNKTIINTLLNDWHKAAAEAKFETYFSYLSTDAIYIGTDATENWNVDQFKAFAKPYFDKGQAWSFTALERNIFFSKDSNLVWFDELLDTQMKICRGSGVLKKENGQWKIVHYVLSMTIPNDAIEKVISVKSAFDDQLIKTFKIKAGSCPFY